MIKKILVAGAAALALASCNGAPDSGSLGRVKPYKTDALIYSGDATALGDAEALSEILDQHGLSYRTVTSEQMDGLSAEDMADYGLILWPGGYAGVMSDSMNHATRDKLKQAVNEYGVSFMGICAGAFIAVSPDTNWGLSLVEAETLPFYHLENDGIDDSMVNVKFADGSQRNLVWWGGPMLTEDIGATIARYADDNTPAIAETYAGRGFMILSGPHPEAPADWRTKLGLEDADGMDWDTAYMLIDAALNRKPLPSFN